MRGVVQKLREKAPLMTETYVAYGATRDLVKECTRAGDYTIPQALDKKAEIPTIENGVHLGVGEGWWYDSMHCHCLHKSDLKLMHCSTWTPTNIRELGPDHFHPHVHATSAHPYVS
jgi:hypothetical protein